MGKRVICLIISIFIMGAGAAGCKVNSRNSVSVASHKVDVVTEIENMPLESLKELQIEKKFTDTQNQRELALLAEKKQADDAALKKKQGEERLAELKRKEEARKKQEAERQAKLASTDNNAREKIFTYMSDESHRLSVNAAAIKLNYGSTANSCVYFASEVLRRVNINIPSFTANCTQLTNVLKDRGWAMHTNYKDLQSGDVCFTTDARGGKGAPTHAYIFMGWVEQGKYDYAYIVDNQAHKYGTVYHVRNIAIVDQFGGDTKEAFRYFMRR